MELSVYVCIAQIDAETRSELLSRSVEPLPNGLHFLVSGTTGKVVQPVLEFLRDKYIRRLLPNHKNQLKKSINTRKATAYDLKDFYDFLDAEKLTLADVDDAALNTYVQSMTNSPSPVTGRPYAERTVIRRLSSVKLLCAWAQRNGLLRHRFCVADVEANLARDDRFLAHLKSVRRTEKFAPEVDEPTAPDKSESVRIPSFDETRRILDALGPPAPISIFATVPNLSEKEFCRDRIMAQCALYAGLRRSEVCGLELSMLTAVRIAADTLPEQMQDIRIFGKGARWRRVHIPTWLIQAMRYYIATERAEVVAAASKRDPAYSEPDRVFLSSVSARTGLGSAVSPDSLDRIFRKAQEEMSMGPLPREPFSYEKPERYVFHDLRHAYAVLTYILRKQRGDADPIKYIQGQLGHVHMSTTSDIYLARATALESTLFDHYNSGVKMLVQTYG
ncbi:tyrosine-type recombinase/integrase [Rhodanobacter sp. Soil772]|uniref:tyrosine-type recombinase/integrase n=1 Tax=Rhodanobacter sp. Soil772 TaxID=1736406 RepID=UPI00138F136F|nr:tyrosine-type recombinase/integrase [Rhodanobacter sp. Soil772]